METEITFSCPLIVIENVQMFNWLSRFYVLANYWQTNRFKDQRKNTSL